MADQVSLLLQAYDRVGRLFAIVELDGDLSDQKAVLTGAKQGPIVHEACARIRISAPGPEADRWLVLDFVPPRGNDAPTADAELRIESELVGNRLIVKSMRFVGEVRCYLGPIHRDSLRVEGLLARTTDQGLAWTRFALDGIDRNLSVRLDDPSQAITLATVSSADPPVLEALGMVTGSRPRVTAGFASAFLPGPQDLIDDAIDDQLFQSGNAATQTYVLQFAQTVTLAANLPEGGTQRMRAGRLLVEMDRALVERAKLHLSFAPGMQDSTDLDGPLVPIRLVQTHAALGFGGVLNSVFSDWVVRIPGVPTIAALASYNRLAIDYHDAVQSVQDGRPVTGLPVFDARVWDPVPTIPTPTFHGERALRRPWMFTFEATDRKAAETPRPELVAALRDEGAVRFRAAFPLGDDRIARGVAFRAWFPGLSRHDFNDQNGQGVLEADFALVRPPQMFLKERDRVTGKPDLFEDQVDTIWRGFWFRLDRVFRKKSDVATARGVDQRIRAGALDLVFAPPLDPLDPSLFDGQPDDGSMLSGRGDVDDSINEERRRTVVVLGLREGRGRFSADVPSVALELRFLVASAAPGGQDGLLNEPFQSTHIADAETREPSDPSQAAIRGRFTRESPLLIPLDPAAVAARLLLQVRERTAVNESRRVAMQLFQWGPGSSASIMPLIVVDRQPFLIAKVWAPALVGITGADGNLEIGNWSADGFEGASWELAGATDGFVAHFPPQALGEGTEKRLGSDITSPPSGASSQVPSRLSPTTRLELQSSYFRQNFTEATWNLRRILGFPGQRAPGAAARSMDFELLYGMGCTVRVDGLRITELEAILGVAPGPLPERMSRPLGRELEGVEAQDAVFARLNFRWSRQFASFSSRLGIYQPWLPTQPRGLLLREGVNYVLRKPDEIMRNPTASGIGDTAKLPGGALWGFEFNSQYDVFVEQSSERKSTYGELARPALSALGGWGYQKAVFQQGLTTIYSDTAMGRTFFYSVERRGRIGCAWNHAKHVVIYERTVGTSKQFRAEQDHHAGRPVLRKVREFIELLQPSRNFPDMGDADVTRGCILGIDFRSKIIPVTSQWGSDVRGPGETSVGYVIPLWQPDADPAIYPKPQVVVRLAGAGGSDESLPCSLDEPQKLMFFSAAESGLAAGASGSGEDFNTDRWPAVNGVDFPDFPWPATTPAQPDPSVNIEAPLPDEAVLAEGYEAFTYAITAPAAADLVAGRSNQPMGALVRNVSLVRADPLQSTNQTASAAASVKTALDVRRNMATATSALGKLQLALHKPLDQASVRDEVNAAIKQVSDSLSPHFPEQFNKVIPPSPLNDWITRGKNSLTKWQKEANGATNEALRKLTGQIHQLKGGIDQVRAEAKRVVRDAWDVYRLALPPADLGLSAIRKRLEAALTLRQRLPDSLELILTESMRELDRVLDGLLGDIVPDPAQQAQLVEFGRRFRARINEAARGLIEPVRASLARELDVKIVDSLIKFVSNVASELETWRTGWERAVTLTVDEIYDEAAKLDVLWDKLPGQIETAVQECEQAASELGKHLEELYKLKVQAGGFECPVGELIDEAKIEERFQRLLTDIGMQDSVDAVTDVVKKELDALEKLREGLPGIDLTSINARLIADTHLLQTLDAQKILVEVTKLAGVPDSDDLEKLRTELTSAIDGVKSQVEQVGQNIAGKLLDQFPDGLVQAAGTTLRLVRAFGEAPNVTGMVFNRARMGYFYLPEAAKIGMPIDMSPATALVNRAGDQLKGLGISLPAGKLLEKVVPPELNNFDFGKLLPDFAGLKLDKLLPELKAPEGLGDKVKVTNQFDRATGRGWAQADVALDEAGPTTLFDAGPIQVTLRAVSFRAQIRIEAGLTGAPRHKQSGRLLSTWDLVFGGTPLVTFHDTELSFDEAGKTKFTLDPTKIEMNGLLSMLSDVLKTVSDPDAGFTLRLKEENGLPVGVEAILLLPLPDLTFGVCSITNLRFGALLELVAMPEFAIGLRIYVGEKLSPFTVAILILGGGGWFDARARYLPMSGRTTTAVSLGINAGAILAISFGPVKGCVFAFLFVEGELQTDSASPGSQTLIVRIGLILGGDVDVMGLITVGIRLILELEYNGTSGDLTGRGTLSIRVKVCFFLTIRFSRTVEKKFVGKSKSDEKKSIGPDGEKRVEEACQQHLERTQ